MKTSFSVTLATFVAAFHPTNYLVAAQGGSEAEAEVSYRIKERVRTRRKGRGASQVAKVLSLDTDQKHRLALGLVKREFEVIENHANAEGTRELYKTNAALTDEEHRMAVRYTLSFDECNGGMTVEECEARIDEILRDDPALFRGLDHINYQVEMLQQPGDYNQHWVGLVTNMVGTHVAGYNGDGIITYYNPNYDRENVWCTSNEPCTDNPNHLRWIPDKCCFAVGPWDCDTGVPKTVDECCDMIKASVPLPDNNGNNIHCHAAHPLGSPEHPVDYSRVHILIDGNGNVVGEPTNE